MEFMKKNPLIILIAGRARSGKSTLARYFKEELECQSKKVVISPYTKYLKQYIEEITGEKIDEEHKIKFIIHNSLIKQLIIMEKIIK